MHRGWVKVTAIILAALMVLTGSIAGIFAIFTTA